MTDYFNKSELFMEPKIQQYGNHMIWSPDLGPKPQNVKIIQK